MKFIRLQAALLALILCVSGLTFPALADDDYAVFVDECFDDFEEGVKGSETSLSPAFTIEANSIGDGYVRVEEDPDGNLFLMSHVFTQVYLTNALTDPYVFSVSSSEMQGAHQAGVFLRAPQGSGAYYEGDGGDPQRGTSTGMSGIWFYTYGNKLEVNVKTFDGKMPNKIADNTVSFDMPEGAYCGNGQYVTLRFEDDGETIAVYADDGLVCTVVLSVGEDTKRARSAGVNAVCCKTVRVLDADGNEALSVSDTLVSLNESVVGWATRVANIKIDNVYIATAGGSSAETGQAEQETEPDVEPLEPSLADELDKSFPVVHKDRAYPWLKIESKTYTYDFSETDITAYSQDPALATASLRTNMVFDGETLKCKSGKSFSFGSGIFLGDDYGFVGGKVSFKLDLLGGSLTVGTRLEKGASDPSRKGLWLKITGTSVTVTEPLSGFYARVPLNPPKGPGEYVITDDVDNVTLSLDGKTIVTVQYLNVHGDLLVRDADGKPVAYMQNTGLNSAGYFTLYANKLDGYIDDLCFDHVTVADTTVLSGDHTPDYSTWVATDDRNRTTPVSDTNTVRADKQVGLFYFVCLTGDITSDLPLDITTLYLTRTKLEFTDLLSDPKLGGGFFWAEPYFGYYKNNDAFIYRRHAYMLEAAGVDFIFLDNTNGATYTAAELLLFDTWKQIREEGGSTPDICVFGGSSSGAVLNNLRGSIYSDANWDKYYDLFYKYEGKPLYLGKESTFGDDNLAWAKEHLTVRDCWAWQDADNTWSWMQEYKISPDGTEVQYVNGGPGRDANGKFEALALCIGHHPTTNKGRSYVNTVFPTVDNDYGFSLDSGAGAGMAGQFEAIKMLDPTVMLITGWNEWSAGLGHDGERVYAGTQVRGKFFMVDTFNTEYSRDAEPMRMRQGDQVGFGDNYYYQMVSIIREFKGQTALPQASGQQTVDIRVPSDWDNVGPVYRDNAGDAAVRHNEGSSVYTMYVNNTARNDFDYAKVSQDKDYLYFTVSCVHDVVKDDGQNWMNLFINLDGDPATGWEGFDFAINRDRDAHYVSIESLADGWDGAHVGQALYTVDGKSMTIRVSKAALGVSGEVSGFLFKWADNSTWTGSVMEFMDLGDTAPNDRFAYKYVGGMGETRDVTYTLDGEALRDECRPLPSHAAPGSEETQPEAQSSGDPAQSATEPGEIETKASRGCKSVLPGILPVILLAGAALGKKKHD